MKISKKNLSAERYIPDEKEPLGLYIHIPYCIKKCKYCAFWSRPGLTADEERIYLGRLVEDIGENGRRYGRRKADTVFFGGGTPSIFSPSSINEIMESVKRSFELDDNAEITMEANPGTLNLPKLKQFKEAGVNRLSLGFQSLSDDILKCLGRIHTAGDCIEEYIYAREAGFDNINVDLIFGIPGQTEEVWEDTLEKVIYLAPDHLSMYSLQLEEETELFNMVERGLLTETSEKEDRIMYHRALSYAEEMGYLHYEISNLALPGKECRHNKKYWSMADYLGIGESASSFIDGKRFTNARRYIPGEPLGFSEFHVNNLFDSEAEFVFTGLRKVEGIKFDEFHRRFGRDFRDCYSKEMDDVKAFQEEGFLLMSDEGIRLTERGFDISNKIMSLFV